VRLVTTIVVAICVFVLGASILLARHDRAPLDDDVREVQRLTMPSDVASLGQVSTTSSSYGVAFSWEIATRMEWQAYVAWVRSRLVSFASIVEAPDVVTFVRSGRGDDHVVRLELVEANPVSRVKVTWRASAS
jgi:hypothetical protein